MKDTHSFTLLDSFKVIDESSLLLDKSNLLPSNKKNTQKWAHLHRLDPYFGNI
jgi:hypothetical protein